MKLWRSGIIWSVLTLVSGLGNFIFSRIIFAHLPLAEFGGANATLTGLITYLGLPVSIVSQAVIHYLAHYKGRGDDARLQGLLTGCQRILLQSTIVGSILAIALADPLAHYFHFRTTLMLAALLTVLVNLWSSFAVALCQGLAWFKRLAILDLVGVGLRLLLGWYLITKYPTAEMAVLSGIIFFLTKACLLYWWKDIFRHGAERVSPWNREFVNFMLVTGAYVVGNCCFLNGDALIAKKYFPDEDLGAYQAASRWGLALVGSVLPLLQVMFTSRSAGKEKNARSDQRILLGLYAVGLACGAATLILLRHFLMNILCVDAIQAVKSEAAAMLVPYTISMAFIGLGQAIGLWSLASRWFKVTAAYGVLGCAYWLVLLAVGHTPDTLLHWMPIGTGGAFVVLLAAWLLTMRRQNPGGSPV